MKFTPLSLVLLAGSLALAPLTVTAGPADSGKGRPPLRMFADLNLTPDQQTKLKALHKAHKGSHKQIFDQMKALREETKAELLKPQPSKQVLDATAARFGDLHKQLAQKRSEHMLELKAVLTPEQFAKLLSRQDKGPRPGFGPRGKKHKGHQCEENPGPDEDR